MLTLPKDKEAIRVLGIDPGGNNLGLSIVEYDIDAGTLVVIESTTLKLTGKDFPQATDRHHARLARLLEMEDRLHSFLKEHQPHEVASESPFMGSFFTAYRGLAECLIVLQRLVYLHNHLLTFHYYSPKQVKGAVGVIMTGGKGMKKDDNKNVIFNYPGLTWNIDRELLDDNAIDSVAVALTHIKGIRG